MEVRAPAVLKLLGEHAVVYGKPFVGVTIDLFARASVSDADDDNLTVDLKDFNKRFSLDRRTLTELYKLYKNRKDINAFLALPNKVDGLILPYAVIASRMLTECGSAMFGKLVDVTSKIPIQSGCASSAACATAFTVALANLCKTKHPDETLIDIARDGERITHKNDGGGRIDVIPSYYGGVVSYSQKGGVTVEEVGKTPDIVVINTGPKKSTAETVGMVAEQYKSKKEQTTRILDEIERCTLSGLESLKNGDLKGLGRDMLRDHELLKMLGLSTVGLDNAVSLSIQNGAYGAKLSGGGGGGIAIAITPDTKRLISVAEKNGFKAFGANVTNKGARAYLNIPS